LNGKLLPAILLSIALLVTGCKDSSPLKSDLEVSINQAFHMNFDYLDHVQVYKRGQDHTYSETLLDLKGDSIRGLVMLLAKAKQTNDSPDIPTFPYKIVLSTSPEGKKYNKKQTSAELLVFSDEQNTYISYEKKLYKLTESLKSFGIE
jgi:hypothetical protein